MEKGVFLCGSPATLRERLERHQKEIGFGYLLPQRAHGNEQPVPNLGDRQRNAGEVIDKHPPSQ